MSDSRRQYHAIKDKLVQLWPQQAMRRQMQSLTVLALMISGIVERKSTQTREVAKLAGLDEGTKYRPIAIPTCFLCAK